MSVPRVYLASASPRRRELLAQIGVEYRLVSVQVDETLRPKEAPGDYVARLALEKARAGRATLAGEADAPVLGADTSVVVEGAILGKPRNRADALEMLGRLSGRDHQVLSAVALVAVGREAVRVQVSRVWFRPLMPGEAEAYWETGEPADKAGAYAIQGRAACFAQRLDGSYSGVMGLPLYETCELLREFAIWTADRGPGLHE